MPSYHRSIFIFITATTLRLGVPIENKGQRTKLLTGVSGISEHLNCTSADRRTELGDGKVRSRAAGP